MAKKLGVLIDKSVETYRRCLMVHDLDDAITTGDVNRVIARSLNTNNIKFKVMWNESTFLHNRRSRCAVVSFFNENYVNEIMQNRPIQLFGKELSVSRQLSRAHYLSHKTTCGLKVKLPKGSCSDQLITNVENYFRQYGQINHREYSNNAIYFIFDDYDSVDRIVLEKAVHKIKGVQVTVEKLLVPNDRRTIVTSDVIEYCIYVTNLPNDVTGKELSDLFRIDAANILIRPYNESQTHLAENDRNRVEVWIKDIGNNEVVQRLANKKNDYCLRGFCMQCQVIPAPVNHIDLCELYQKGKCPFFIGCRRKHIRCTNPTDCRDTQCWYGHDQQRRTHSKRPPILDEDSYRVRISNFPPDVTRPEIFRRLRLRFFRNQSNLVIFNENDPSAPTIVYVTDERTLAFVKELIHAWHDQQFSKDKPCKMQCQLEMNVNYYSSMISSTSQSLILPPKSYSPTPSVISSIRSEHVRLSLAHKKMLKPRLQTVFSNECCQQDQILASFGLPDTWFVDDPDMSLNQTDTIYSVSDRTNPNKRALLKIYSTISDKSSRLRVERHRSALQRLTEVEGVSKLIDCNYEKSTISPGSWKRLWLMIEKPEGTRLDVYLSTESTSFEEKMKIILALIDLVAEMHQNGVIHRNLIPSNIYLQSFISVDNETEFRLELVDFDFAHVPAKENQRTTDTNLLEIDNPMKNDFYLPVQFEVKPLNNNDIDDEKESTQLERQSPTIDTNYICAILFWMITYQEPKEARDREGKAPHYVSENKQLIDDTIKLVTNGCLWKIHSIKNHLQLTFDRAFGNSQPQWSLDALKYQIQFLVEVLNSMKEHDVSIESKPVISLNEQFLRLALLISRMKEEFVRYKSRFSPSVHWSNNENNKWSGHIKAVTNYDLLSIDGIQLQIKFQVNQLENEDQIRIIVSIKITESTIVELPIGDWQEKEIETIIEMFIRELSSFYNLFSE